MTSLPTTQFPPGLPVLTCKSNWKRIVLALVLSLSMTAGVYAQKNPTRIYGTVSIDETSSMDATEVTMSECIYFIINNGFHNEDFPNLLMIPYPVRMIFEDLKEKEFKYITIIDNARPYSGEYGEKGFKLTKTFYQLISRDSTYFSINLPVVGISFSQAQRFCGWRESVVNKTRAVKVRITLPSAGIYKNVNENKDSLCKKSRKCIDCARYQLNYSHPICISSSAKLNKQLRMTLTSGLQRADNYWPSKLGLYNIQGNAAEMTATEGIAVGGSFRHFANQSYRDQTQTYTKEEDWLGFRCLITLQ